MYEKGKVPGPSGLLSDLLKSRPEVSIKELTTNFNEFQVTEKVPEEWTRSLRSLHTKEKELLRSVENNEESCHWKMDSGYGRRFET